MEIERAKFLACLSTAAPALADRDLIPVLQHFLFNQSSVVAYNNQIAISVPCDTDFEGTARGDVLISLMKAATSPRLKIASGNDILQIKAGRANLKVPTMPANDFEQIFRMPAFKTKKPMPVPVSAFLDAMESCLRTVNSDTTVPDQLGVTVVPYEDGLGLFSTNNKAITDTFVECDGYACFEERVIIPELFCQQLLRLASRKDKKMMLEQVGGDYVLYRTEDDVTLFGQLIAVESPYDFDDTIEKNMAKMPEEKVEIPKALSSMVDRALIILNGALEGLHTHVSIKDGKMVLFTKSEKGEVTDTVDFPALAKDAKGRRKSTPTHPEVDCRIDPKYLKQACDYFTHMTVSRDCALFVRKDVKCLVAATGV